MKLMKSNLNQNQKTWETEELVNPEYTREGFIYGKDKLVMNQQQQVL